MGQGEGSVSRPLEAFRNRLAYVLLGDPGAGKTTAFKTERAVCEALGEPCLYITVREFRAPGPQSHPERRDKTLFIDGLDEVRAGSSDARVPCGDIRGRLDQLGRPWFRLSCREADWLGGNDRRHLESVSPDAAVAVLRLDSLTDGDIAEILAAHSSRLGGLPPPARGGPKAAGRPSRWPASRWSASSTRSTLSPVSRQPQTGDLPNSFWMPRGVSPRSS